MIVSPFTIFYAQPSIFVQSNGLFCDEKPFLNNHYYKTEKAKSKIDFIVFN